MKRFWSRFFDGAVYGFIVLCLAVFLFGTGVKCGIDVGRDETRKELERQGGGRYIDIWLDQREYRGWVR